MIRFIGTRLAQNLLVLLAILTLSFFVMKAAPGSPLARDRRLDPEIEQMLMERYRLDEPVVSQFGYYLSLLAKGDLGPSIKQRVPVSEIIADSAPYSLLIGVQSLLVALLLGIPAGLLGGLRQNTAVDQAAMAVAMLGVSVPNFVLGPILILIFSVGLGWYNSGGWTGWSDSVLPSLTLGLYYTAYVSRLTRGGMLEVVRQDYIRTARAKGLTERLVVARHALRGALLPVISFLGPAAASVLTGSVVVEKVFNVPGLGTFFVDAAFNRDYFLVLGVILVYSSLLVTFNLLVDLLYSVVDPRVRLE